MTLTEQIEHDYFEALKNRQTSKVEVLRLLKSSLKNEAIKIGGLGTELTPEQVLSVLNREVKQRKDSIAQYKSGNRNDLAEKEEAELSVIQSYMPEVMGAEELNQIIDQVLVETGASQKADMGKVMAALKLRITNPADVSRAAGVVSERLQ